MRNGTLGFLSDRLVEARDARGLTQIALAELINRTSSSISRWEAGGQSPEPEALDALSRSLNVPVTFFLQPNADHGDAPMFFRSMASTTQSIRKRTKVRMRWAQNLSLNLQNWLDLPDVNVPRLDATKHQNISSEDIEKIASECRKVWNLGNGPIPDVLLVLENAGIVVVKEEIGTVKMDGLSNWSSADGRPYILIASDKQTCVRSRMDAAHELGHLVLHHSLNQSALNNSSDFKEIERQAFEFAGAFLLPAESFATEVWSPSLGTFVALKERWKVSIAAMIMRCAKLDMVTEEGARRLWKHYSSRGWRKSEPLDDTLVSERPRLLSRSIRLLIDEGVQSRDELLNEFRLNGQDVEALCGLPRGYMTAKPAEIVTLPTLKRSAQAHVDSSVVVPFVQDEKNET
ncbi:hypothetical protein A9Q96_00510 [Rhodobacterales bacterium 52_120_T64]|nr:hypothetical protein A9Q96_00510 [Rhodobacterales bacterium 52_120_T64]